MLLVFIETSCPFFIRVYSHSFASELGYTRYLFLENIRKIKY